MLRSTSLHFTAGEDYEEQMNTEIIFPSGSPLGTTVCADISIVNDEKVEDITEIFSFDLSSADPVDFSGSNGMVFIIDDDGKQHYFGLICSGVSFLYNLFTNHKCRCNNCLATALLQCS